MAPRLERLTEPGTDLGLCRFRGMAKPLLPDDLWAVIEPLLPEERPNPRATDHECRTGRR